MVIFIIKWVTIDASPRATTMASSNVPDISTHVYFTETPKDNCVAMGYRLKLTRTEGAGKQHREPMGRDGPGSMRELQYHQIGTRAMDRGSLRAKLECL